MSEPFLGEIRMFAFDYAPRSWAHCDGALLPISQYQSLYALLSTRYGGDGRTSFALPDLRGRVPVHVGQGPGLTDRTLGQRAGEESTTLTAGQMPSHSHPATVHATDTFGDRKSPAGGYLAKADDGENNYSGGEPNVLLHASNTTIANCGGGQAHNNMPPLLVLNFCIAMAGIFPPRS